MTSYISQEELRRMLDYDPETGVFTRHVSGRIAGTVRPDGYNQISVNKKLYLAHRLAWVYIYGAIPDGLDIDHKNRIKTENWIENLRCVTHSINLQNQRRPRLGNTSGYLGVYWRKDAKKWQAQITTNGINKYLGLFSQPELAHEAYLTAKRDLHEGGMF